MQILQLKPLRQQIKVGVKKGKSLQGLGSIR